MAEPLMITELQTTQHAMNPASIVWPRWPEEVQAQQKSTRKWREEKPLTFVNPEALR